MSSFLVHYANAQHKANMARRAPVRRPMHDQLLEAARGRVWRRIVDR